MTIADLSKLSDEELDRAIAEAVAKRRIETEGLELWQRDDDELLYGGYPSRGLWIYRKKDHPHFLLGSNYETAAAATEGFINDNKKPVTKCLNACAAVEAGLTDEQFSQYCEHLNAASGADVETGTPSFVAYFASARQRTIALIATLTP